MLAVEEFPEVHAGGTQAETMTAIWVEENGPVVKLLPEHDVRVAYRFVLVFQGRSP
jgi:hypothetical protein